MIFAEFVLFTGMKDCFNNKGTTNRQEKNTICGTPRRNKHCLLYVKGYSGVKLNGKVLQVRAIVGKVAVFSDKSDSTSVCHGDEDKICKWIESTKYFLQYHAN